MCKRLTEIKITDVGGEFAFGAAHTVLAQLFGRKENSSALGSRLSRRAGLLEVRAAEFAQLPPPETREELIFQYFYVSGNARLARRRGSARFRARPLLALTHIFHILQPCTDD